MGRNEVRLKGVKKQNKVIKQVGKAVRDIDSQQKGTWRGKENKPSRK